MNTVRTLLAFAALSLTAFVGCSKSTPEAFGTIEISAARAEVYPTVPALLADDNALAVLDHTWTEKQVYAFVASRWHDREYVADLKDCDDFTDDLVHFIRREFRERADVRGKGGAAIGPIDVHMPAGWHQIALIRTQRGWFVCDPQVFNRKTRTLDLIPLTQYPHPSRWARFGTS